MTKNDTTPQEQESQIQLELQDWIDSAFDLVRSHGEHVAVEMLVKVREALQLRGIKLPYLSRTPYINSIPLENQPPYPGDGQLEWRIRSLIRWNAMAMVVRANRVENGIGGHISTFASAATLYEVAFNHFFRGPGSGKDRDLIYFQGHAAPGIYARAFLEGRLNEKDLENFRRELKPEGGLSSYPHPFLMPGFWEFPTVSMGLGPIMAIYQARFNKYLENRGLKEPGGKVWAFLGDGETDEPETLGAIALAAREKLDNLIFVINCNLQRLDGPVRGNGKIIQELEGDFKGAGWDVIKVVWGGDWDPLMAKDSKGLLVKRCDEVVDGWFQKYVVEPGSFIREHFFGVHPELKQMVDGYTDDQLRRMRRGGHDPEKVFAAYKKATENTGVPTVILAKTIKGYGLGESGEGKNITHQQKKMNEDELRQFRTRYGIPIADDDVSKAPFYRPADDSPEISYLKSRRKELGGSVPQRPKREEVLQVPEISFYEEFFKGTGDHEVSTTMALVRILTKLLKDPHVGKRVVPILSDEARTFGMEALFRQVGIYSSEGQLYEPVDSDSLLYYKEIKDGQILEEGITEAGCMASFNAAGTCMASHGFHMIPFFVYYSMFGLQRVGDLVWAASDMRTRGFMVGGTAGRTTLAGEGLQHQDGHSHLLALPIPTLMAYDPAFAFEVAIIVHEGLKRMYVDQEEIFYYITVMNENYPQPAMPQGVEEGVLKGLYKFRTASAGSKKTCQLLGSGAILNETLRAADYLEKNFSISSDVFSVTSYKELYRDATQCERGDVFGSQKNQPYVSQILNPDLVTVAASDYVRALPLMLAKWMPENFHVLGTDGFGLSEGRTSLRDYFEVDWQHIAFVALTGLAKKNLVSEEELKKAKEELKIDSEKRHPNY